MIKKLLVEKTFNCKTLWLTLCKVGQRFSTLVPKTKVLNEKQSMNINTSLLLFKTVDQNSFFRQETEIEINYLRYSFYTTIQQPSQKPTFIETR